MASDLMIPRSLTIAELHAEMKARFPTTADVAFQCPICGDIAKNSEFPEEGGCGQECIGRHMKGRGCNFAAYGLIPGPWEIVFPDGKKVRSFPLAPAP